MYFVSVVRVVEGLCAVEVGSCSYALARTAVDKIAASVRVCVGKSRHIYTKWAEMRTKPVDRRLVHNGQQAAEEKELFEL